MENIIIYDLYLTTSMLCKHKKKWDNQKNRVPTTFLTNK